MDCLSEIRVRPPASLLVDVAVNLRPHWAPWMGYRHSVAITAVSHENQENHVCEKLPGTAFASLSSPVTCAVDRPNFPSHWSLDDQFESVPLSLLTFQAFWVRLHDCGARIPP